MNSPLGIIQDGKRERELILNHILTINHIQKRERIRLWATRQIFREHSR